MSLIHIPNRSGHSAIATRTVSRGINVAACVSVKNRFRVLFEFLLRVLVVSNSDDNLSSQKASFQLLWILKCWCSHSCLSCFSQKCSFVIPFRLDCVSQQTRSLHGRYLHATAISSWDFLFLLDISFGTY